MSYPDLRQLPKALLHDHLDGGMRAGTVLELADDVGYLDLPQSDPAALADWFHQKDAGHLVRYLEAFVHTIAVTQTPQALERAAYECASDLAADGVIYAEVRFGPSLHTRASMAREDAIEAVLAGFDRGKSETGLLWGVIVTALRDDDDSLDVAKAGARFSGSGVVGFDLAGPEAGHPADEHLAACRVARESGLGVTIHAGEHDGPASVWRAVARCGALRVGHGARLIEDCHVTDGEIRELGGVATMIRDQRVPLELCITSNLHIGLAEAAADHPFGALMRAGFRVTLNTDNRLMSGITLSDEFALAYREIGLSIEALGLLTEATLEAGFGDWSDRARLINDVVRPAYASERGR